ncbi:hypothetical protein RC99_05065 [Pectobacterium carotovorum subsp. carotovorum]|nr:hypothetical protein RC99_05065 [Pectobacterium carotovorum subsp. carotovorum]
MAPVIIGLNKVLDFFTSIFTIIILSITIKCQLKTIGCCHNMLSIDALKRFGDQHHADSIVMIFMFVKQMIID